MKKLLNTLYINSPDAYACLDGENVVVKVENDIKGRFPLHILEGIYIFSYAGASPSLIGKCIEEKIDITLCSPTGRFLAKPCGRSTGNVLLRREQYRIADADERKLDYVRNFIIGKIVNERSVINRTIRDHKDRINVEEFSFAIEKLKNIAKEIENADSIDSIRGFEGSAANIYFSLFDDMILRNKQYFYFHQRNRRPPLDNVNALLSYVYMMLTSMCSSALESVGLDSYVGFMHTDRAGRVSLALDLVEELRPCFADRFVLSVINNGIICEKDFLHQAGDAVLITEDGRKKIQQAWQKKKQEVIEVPYLKEKVEWGLIPYVQSMLLARCIRGNIDGYPSFVWR